MNRRLLAYLLMTLLAIPALAGSDKLVRLEGWIVDSYCGAKNAKVEATEDTRSCHKKGAKLVFVTADGTTYALTDQEKALEYVGGKIGLFGTVDKDRNLNVGNYLGSDKKGAGKNRNKRGFGLKSGK